MKRQSVFVLAVVVLTSFLSQAVERTSVAGVKVKLDDSLLREVIEGVKYIIDKIMSPFGVIIIISLFILIFIVGYLLRLFRR